MCEWPETGTGGSSDKWYVSNDLTRQELRTVLTQLYDWVEDSRGDEEAVYAVTPYNPATVLGSLETLLSTLGGVVNSVEPTAVITGLTEGKTWLDTNNMFSPDSWGSVAWINGAVTEAITKALGALSTLVDNAESTGSDVSDGLVLQTSDEIQTYLASAKDKAKIDLENKFPEALGDAELTGISLNGDADSDASTDTMGFLSGLQDDISPDVSTAIGDCINALLNGTYNIGSVMTSALAAAQAAVVLGVDTPITTLADNHELDNRDRYMRARNRIAEGFADIGATNSSGFFVGMALIEGEEVREVSRYSAELQYRVFLQTFEQFVGMFNQSMNTWSSNYVAQFSSYASVYSAKTQAYLESFLRLFQQWMSAYLQEVTTYTTGADDVAKRRLQAFMSILGPGASMVDTLGGSYSEFMKTMQVSAMHGYSDTTRLIGESYSRMVSDRAQAYNSYIEKYGDYARTRIVGQKEYVSEQWEHAVRKKMFPGEVFKTYGAIFAANSGGSPGVSSPPKAQTALSTGIMAAGALGAIPGIGVPAALGLGALTAVASYLT